MILHLLLFLSVATAVLAFLHLYLWHRLVHHCGWPAPWRRLSTLGLLLLCLSIPLALLVSHFSSVQVARLLSWLPYTWLGMMLLLVAGAILLDLFQLVNYGGGRLVGTGHSQRRRQFVQRLGAASVLLAAGAVTPVALARAAQPCRVVQRRFSFANWPASLDGFRLVQISDLHLGFNLDRDQLAEVVAQVNKLQPDLVAITGDLVDGSLAQLGQEATALAQLQAPHGVYFVTGNHEYYSGVDEWLTFLAGLGIRVLRNEHLLIGGQGDGFYLAGIDDHTPSNATADHGADLAKALRGCQTDHEVVLLAHQPRAIKEAAAHGVSLVLSGHTHGGQIFPFNLLVKLQQPYVAGVHRQGKTWLAINQGTGHWGPPMRLGTFNEITEVRLWRKRQGLS